MPIPSADIAIAGGGLAGSITAAFIKRKRPDLNIVIIDQAQPKISQTWSFHKDDISAEAFELIKPLLSACWQGYSVHFPNNTRRLGLTYCSIRAKDFWAKIPELLQGVTLLHGDIQSLESNSIRLRDGTEIGAIAVLDARGLDSDSKNLRSCGWQKFAGLEIETSEPHGFTEPVIMDARVSQTDGFRFFYLLPYTDKKLLIEDTYYSDDRSLDVPEIELRIEDYLEKSKIGSFQITGCEQGILPIPLTDSYLRSRPNTASVGMRGGFFHPTTGYSLPLVVACAEELGVALQGSERANLAQVVNAAVSQSRDTLKQSAGFLIRLNRMLFRAGDSEERWKILSQFYLRNEKVISQFYSGSLRFSTKVAMVTGIPPVPVFSGLKHFFGDFAETAYVGEAVHG